MTATWQTTHGMQPRHKNKDDVFECVYKLGATNTYAKVIHWVSTNFYREEWRAEIDPYNTGCVRFQFDDLTKTRRFVEVWWEHLDEW